MICRLKAGGGGTFPGKRTLNHLEPAIKLCALEFFMTGTIAFIAFRFAYA